MPTSRTPLSQNPTSSLFTCFLVSLILTIVIFVFVNVETKISKNVLSSEVEYIATTIPKTYSDPESIGYEDRDVLQDLFTSFLPREEFVMIRKNVKFKYCEKKNLNKSLSRRFNSLVKLKSRRAAETIEDYTPKIDYSTDSDEEDDYQNPYETKNPVTTEKEPNEYGINQEPENSATPEDPIELESEDINFNFWRSNESKEFIRATQARIMEQYMDQSANPCEDFYQFACGNWRHYNKIPADKSTYNTFEMLRSKLDIILRDLLAPTGNNVDEFVNPKLSLDEPVSKVFLKYDICVEEDLDSVNIDSNLKCKTELDVAIKETKTIQENHKNTHEKYKLVIVKTTTNETEFENNDVGKQQDNTVINYNENRSKTIHGSKQYDKENNNFNKHDEFDSNKSKDENYKKDVILECGTEKKIEDGIDNNKTECLNENNANETVSDVEKINEHDKEIKTDTNEDKQEHEIEIFIKESKTEDEINRIRRHLQRSMFRQSRDLNNESIITNNTDTDTEDAMVKAKNYYKSCLNEDVLSKRGAQPLLDLLELLGGWPILSRHWTDTEFDWLGMTAKLKLFNNDILISEWVGLDMKNSSRYIIQFDQTTLGLPTREYFLRKSYRTYLEAYANYVIEIAILLGGEEKHVKMDAAEMINFEIELAKITTPTDLRGNISELYHRFTVLQLQDVIPEIDWERYLAMVLDRPVELDEPVVVLALDYLTKLADLVKDTKPRAIANYLLWRFIKHRVSNLDDRHRMAKQKFYLILYGRQESPPRWRTCVSVVNSNMGMALGAMFVQQYFDESSKNDNIAIIKDIQEAFRELLLETEWMENKTKDMALNKLDSIILRIGYPDYILNKEDLNEKYEGLQIDPNKYFENTLNILYHTTRRDQMRLSDTVNKTVWNTYPAIVNAYYSRNKNQIIFPAGILQPPFYHKYFPRSLNYGGIGVVIGHEVTHGFDDKGRLFNSDGNMQRWWTDADVEAFHERSQCIIQQYEKFYVPEVDMHVNGGITQGENIADNGGVKQAFRAYLHWTEKNGVEEETLPGLNYTNTQLFFINFAQIWCGDMRPNTMKNKLKSSVHPPGRFRVIGALRNSEDFANEFACSPGTTMNPEEKCTVW